MATSTNNKMMNTQSKNIIIQNKFSPDAPPLDFSYKNIKDLADLKFIDTRGGKRKPIIIEIEESKNDKKKKKEMMEGKQENVEQEKEEKAQAQHTGTENEQAVENVPQNNIENQKIEEKNENEDKDKDKEKDKEKEKDKKEDNQTQQPAQQTNLKKGPDVIRVIPSNNIQNTIQTHNILLNNTNTKNMIGKNFEETNIYSQKKVVNVHLECKSLILSYNEIRYLDGFFSIIDAIMYNCNKLAWLDLSHNYLVTLNYNFKEFPDLRTFYLHCNFIKDLKELSNLKDCKNLKSITVHGNPIEAIPNFRIYIIGILPQIKKIDTVLVSKKEKDNAFVWINSFKNIVIPENKNAAKPPENAQTQTDQK